MRKCWQTDKEDWKLTLMRFKKRKKTNDDLKGKIGKRYDETKFTGWDSILLKWIVKENWCRWPMRLIYGLCNWPQLFGIKGLSLLFCCCSARKATKFQSIISKQPICYFNTLQKIISFCSFIFFDNLILNRLHFFLEKSKECRGPPANIRAWIKIVDVFCQARYECIFWWAMNFFC